MRSRFAFLLAGLLACSRAAGPETEVSTATSPPPAIKPAPAPPPAPPPTPPPPAAPQVTVEMTAATLADRCGDQTPNRPPAPAAAPSSSAPRAKEARSQDRDEPDARSGVGARGARRSDMACEQTSMQLAVTSPAGAAPVEIAVKKVELYDENGKHLGDLASRSPTVWDASAYKPWDQKVASGAQLSVSYLLAPPNWGAIGGRHSRMYTLKAVITVGGADRTLQRDVQVMGITTLPPNVRT